MFLPHIICLCRASRYKEHCSEGEITASLTNRSFKVHSRAGFYHFLTRGSSAGMCQYIFKEFLFLLRWASSSGRLNRRPGRTNGWCEIIQSHPWPHRGLWHRLWAPGTCRSHQLMELPASSQSPEWGEGTGGGRGSEQGREFINKSIKTSSGSPLTVLPCRDRAQAVWLVSQELG